MELTFKIIYVGLILLGLLLIHASIRNIVRVINAKNMMHRDIEMYKMKYSEQDILSHLDFIIEECLDFYITMNITPKQLYYINNATEAEIVTKLGETVPSRISPALYSQLSLIYDISEISKVIGEKIYLKVLEYVIEFNIANENKIKNKKIN